MIRVIGFKNRMTNTYAFGGVLGEYRGFSGIEMTLLAYLSEFFVSSH
jgi:hypothetical protein